MSWIQWKIDIQLLQTTNIYVTLVGTIGDELELLILTVIQDLLHDAMQVPVVSILSVTHVSC